MSSGEKEGTFPREPIRTHQKEQVPPYCSTGFIKRCKARYTEFLVATLKCKETEVLAAKQLCIFAIRSLKKQFTNVMVIMLYLKLKSLGCFRRFNIRNSTVENTVFTAGAACFNI